jgi:hypothetical protein
VPIPQTKNEEKFTAKNIEIMVNKMLIKYEEGSLPDDFELRKGE